MASSTPILLLIIATIAIFGLMVAPPCAADNALTSAGRSSIGRDESLTSGDYSLTMRSDCDVVKSIRGITVWRSFTNGLGSGCRLELTSYGALEILDENNRLIRFYGEFRTEKASYALVLHNDGSIVSYGPSEWNWRGRFRKHGLDATATTVAAAAEQVNTIE